MFYIALKNYPALLYITYERIYQFSHYTRDSERTTDLTQKILSRV